MTLINKFQFNELVSNGSPANNKQDHFPVVKLYLPYDACIWLLTEIDPDNHDLAYGLCIDRLKQPIINQVSLKEIRNVRFCDRFKFKADRNFFAHYRISKYLAAAQQLFLSRESEWVMRRVLSV